MSTQTLYLGLGQRVGHVSKPSVSRQSPSCLPSCLVSSDVGIVDRICIPDKVLSSVLCCLSLQKFSTMLQDCGLIMPGLGPKEPQSGSKRAANSPEPQRDSGEVTGNSAFCNFVNRQPLAGRESQNTLRWAPVSAERIFSPKP